MKVSAASPVIDRPSANQLEARLQVPGARGAQLRFEEFAHGLSVGHRTAKLELERAAVSHLVPADQGDHPLRPAHAADAPQQPKGIARFEHPNRQHPNAIDTSPARLLPDLRRHVLEHAFRSQRTGRVSLPYGRSSPSLDLLDPVA